MIDAAALVVMSGIAAHWGGGGKREKGEVGKGNGESRGEAGGEMGRDAEPMGIVFVFKVNNY